MSQSEQKGADQLTRLCNMYLGGNLGKCLIFRLPSRAVDIIILPRFGSFRLEPIFTGIAGLVIVYNIFSHHKQKTNSMKPNLPSGYLDMYITVWNTCN